MTQALGKACGRQGSRRSRNRPRIQLSQRTLPVGSYTTHTELIEVEGDGHLERVQNHAADRYKVEA